MLSNSTGNMMRETVTEASDLQLVPALFRPTVTPAL
jgi:hypothetical protein